MTEHRTDGVAEMIDAVDRALPGWSGVWDGDAVQLTAPGGFRLSRPVIRRTSLTPAMATRLVREASGPALVIADIVDSVAAETLTGAGHSFWDRRGRLVLQSRDPLVLVDRPTPTYVGGAEGPSSDRPITGKAGLAVALALCMWPDDPSGVREVARIIEMSASTVSDARSRLLDHGLVASNGKPLLPELFWALSDAWAPTWRPSSAWPGPSPDWRQTGHGAASRFGAATMTGTPQAYTDGRRTLDQYLVRHIPRDGATPFLVAVAPTPLAVRAGGADGGHQSGVHLVHPVVAALDLSRDVRGREILASWSDIDTSWVPTDAFRGPEPQPVWL